MREPLPLWILLLQPRRAATAAARAQEPLAIPHPLIPELRNMLFFLSGSVLTAALLAGGGTHAGFLADIALQLLAIPLLCAALWPAFSQESSRRKSARLALWVCGIAALVSTIQLCPLFFDYWSGRPGGLLKGAGELPPLLRTPAVSLTPEASWAAALSLTVPLAVFAATVQLRLDQRIRLCVLLAGLGALSLLLGFLQVAQGSESFLRFYEVTNPSEAVGFFANRNHFAALLNVTLVLAAVWFWMAAEAASGWKAFESRSILWLAAAASFFVATASGLAMARSRAGMGLAIVALLGIVLMSFKQSPATGASRGQVGGSRAVLAAALFAVLFAVQFGLGTMLSRFEGDPLEDARPALSRTAFKTAFEALPFGTGLGSFVRVYATTEKSEDAGAAFANRAHNDAVELFLETGLLGASLLLAFLVWYARRTWAAWQPGNPPLASMLEKAASLIVGLLLLHSLVDYPLRTTALGAVFSFFCAVLAVPATTPAPSEQANRKPGGRERPHKAAPRPIDKWQADGDWPGSGETRC
jgi:O-antigen ligase